MKKFLAFFLPLFLGAAIGGYAGFLIVRVDLVTYQTSSEYQEELLTSRLSRLDSTIEQLEVEEKKPLQSLGKSFQSKLLQQETAEGQAQTLPSEMLKKRKKEKEALAAKMKALKQSKKKEQKKEQSLIAKILEKRNAVQELQKKISYWLNAKPQDLPKNIQLTVIGGELNPAQKTQLALAYKLFPPDFPDTVKLTVTFADPNMRNGMAGKGIIILKGQNEDLFFQTIIHEAGHAYGLRDEHPGEPSGFYDLQIPIALDDVTYPYYSISWKNNHTAMNDAFPSIYGKTDPFEDYAESFIYYIIQGKAFRQEASQDPVKAQKYAYMKQMFKGKEFNALADFVGIPFSIQEIAFDPEHFFSVNP